MNIYLELFGYLGTALVLLSMMMTSVVKLRIINMSGSVISAIYAALSNTWPVVLLNLGLIIINAFQLLRLKQSSKTE
ncbi:MAG: YgjV family protein [Oscillospiraceae bacterium]|nr:YgjV family protein [Oscillospiraceae bacterium]